MAVTYGDEMLARAESVHRTAAARRRRLTLMGPATAATLWALADLVAARHARLTEIDAGFVRHVIDHGAPIIWTIAFVALPLIAALKRDPIPAGAALGFLAGPALSPALFGPGGWKWWQIATVIWVVVVVFSAVTLRPRPPHDPR